MSERLIEWLEAEVKALHGVAAPDVGLADGWEWVRYPGGLDQPGWELRDGDGRRATRIVTGDVRCWEDWGHTARGQSQSLTGAMRGVSVHHGAVLTADDIAKERARIEDIEARICVDPYAAPSHYWRMALTAEEVEADRIGGLTQLLEHKLGRLDKLEAAPWVRPTKPFPEEVSNLPPRDPWQNE